MTARNDKAVDYDIECEVLAQLERSCEGLDGATRSRLNSIRHAALERHGRSRDGALGRALLAPFGGVVTVCLLLVAVIVMLPRGSAPPGEVAPSMQDLEILTSEESLEFYEDYEFYQWLAENDLAA